MNGTLAGTNEATLSAVPMCLPDVAGNGGRRAGAACSRDDQCESQWCETRTLGGLCTEFCCSDASCPQGQTCEFFLVQDPAGQVHTARACVFPPTPDRLRQD